MNNNSIDQLESIIEELQKVILLMCNDMDSTDNMLDKETIRRAILIENERLKDLRALHHNMSKKSE